jgi:glycosyltransferase domain-containing protein
MTLSNLTVIIPSYDRQEFLLKQFIHWSDTHAKLIIVDGSIKPIAKNIQELFKLNGNTTYIHLEESVGNRLLVASKLITTPYTVTSNDDDFLIKSGVISSVEYLERNSRVVACRGQSIRAYILKNKKTIRYTGIFNKLMQSIPHAIIMAMLAGVLLVFGTRIFTSTRINPLLGLLMLFVFYLVQVV